MNQQLPAYICPSCGITGKPGRSGHRCACGTAWQLDFKAGLPKNLVQQRAAGLWRYREALPVDCQQRVSLGESMTALLPFEHEGRMVLLKCEHHLPTGSYKARGAAVLVSALAQAGIERFKEDSSGNAGAAMAAYAGRAGLEATIFIPESASGGKLMQVEEAGALLIRVPGKRQAATDALHEYLPEVEYASHIWNPFFSHGVKTMAYEIVEQLSWRQPEALLMPVGHGSLLLALWLGFRELQHLGIIHNPPRLIGVQAAGCPPLADSWRQRPPSRIMETAAEGIAIAEPARPAEVLAAVEQSGGDLLEVSEQQILEANQVLKQNGILVEPTSAVAFAGWLNGSFDGGSVVIPLTGNGLKSLLSFDSR